MRGVWVVLLVLLYLGSMVFSYGALFAHFQGDPSLSASTKQGLYRVDIGIALVASLIPGCNVVWALLETGFLEHGWRLH
jgi:hypothetical protein